MYELMVQHAGELYMPEIEGAITWSTERKGAAGELSFTYMKDGGFYIASGDAISFRVNGKDVFYGFSFNRQGDKTLLRKVKVFDQLRYFKNKDTYVYENKTLGEVVEMLAKDFNLQVGHLENTGFRIASKVEDNTELFDVVHNASDITLGSTGQLYVLYDDFGKLTLKNVENMRVDILLDAETGEDLKFSAGIETDVYNRIKLTFDNEDTGRREVYIAQNSEKINQWGLLQNYDTLQKGENGQAKADALLALYGSEKKTLQLSRQIGDVRVRAGALVPVMLNLGDFKVQNYMLVEKCKHTFSGNEHWMDLTMRGGDIVAG